MIRPNARTDGLLIEELDGEVVVYDTTNDRAHCLTATAAAVWRACNGNRTPAEIACCVAVDESVVRQALRALDDARLLREPLPKAKPTRRQAIVAAATIPLVTSITTPAAAQAASCLGFRQPCSPTGRRCCPPRRCRNVPPFGFICI